MHPGAHAATDPDRAAVVMDDGTTRTYAELDAAANRVAAVLRERGLEPGDHVALCVGNEPEFFDLVWGAHYAGLLYTACSTRLTGEELAYIVDDCGARALVLGASQAEKAADVWAGTPRVEHRFSIGGAVEGCEPLEDAVAAASDRPLPDRVAGGDMLYSSGTTGRPKGIKPMGERPPLDTPMLFTGVLSQALGMGAGDVYLSPAPLYHAAPLRGCMGVHQLGGTVVVMRRFDAETALALIDRHGVGYSQMVPTMFVRMLRLPAGVRDASDVSSLRGVLHAGAPCPVEIKRQMIDWWGPILFEYYASTEACGLTFATSQDWIDHPGTVGRALVGVAHVTGDAGEELPAGETGTIWFSDGPPFEYHNDPAKTAEAHDDRGWATSGDIGHLDADGYLYLTDRKAHMIITGGVNVYPREAEDVLIADERVIDAAVFGVPNEEFGEEVKAVVQPAEMPADGVAAEALERELIARCRERLADLKCPRSVDFRAQLPRHDTGKLYKRLLVDEYRAAAAAAQPAR